MKKIYNYTKFILLLLIFCCQLMLLHATDNTNLNYSLFPPHIENYANDTILYIRNIYNEDIQKFLNHIVEQHFGLNSNSYARYEKGSSLDKYLRSEFVLYDFIIVDKLIEPSKGENISLFQKKVEEIALNNYLFEILISKCNGDSFKSNLSKIICKLKNLDNIEKIKCEEKKKEKKKENINGILEIISCLNNPEILNRLTAISTRLANYGNNTYLENVNNICDIIKEFSDKSVDEIDKAKIDLIKNKLGKENIFLNMQILQSYNFSHDVLTEIARQILINTSVLNYDIITINRNENNINININYFIGEENIQESVLKMVSKTIWYNSAQKRLISLEERNKANHIMLGLIKDNANRMFVTTMYPVLHRLVRVRIPPSPPKIY